MSKRKPSKDRCLLCHEPHHRWELSEMVLADFRERTGRASSLHDEAIGDAIYHITLDLYIALQEAGRTHDEVIATLGDRKGPMGGLGTLMASMQDRAREQGRSEGVRSFFEQLAATSGPGVYTIEIDEHGGQSMLWRQH